MTILDLITKETRTFKSEFPDSYWLDGNGSCDCNRQSYFDLELEGEPNICIGEKRFVIIDYPENKELTLEELNDGYDLSLLKDIKTT